MKDENAEILAIGGIFDHVHLLLQTNGRCDIPRLIRKLKARSSRFVKEINGEGNYFAWQEGYSVCSVTPSIVTKTKNYIKNQEEHHKKLLYDDEIKLLLSL